MIRIAQPIIGEEERRAVLRVLDSGQLVNGPVTRELERRFAAEVSGTAEAVAVANGTAALHLALLAHGIGPGDEVITTPFTFQATANMVLATGARPVFVDVKEDGNIDESLIEAAITPRTKAILPVHLYGRLCDIDAIEGIARQHGLALIEDAAQAHGARRSGRRAGAAGTGCFSLYATKNMTSGEGGVVTTDDASLAARLRLLRSHGEESRYSSSILGFNYRMTEFQAALALAQLDRLGALNARRRQNALYLSQRLRGLVLPPCPEDEGMVWHLYTVRVPRDRDGLAAWLAGRGIQTGIYYPTPIPDQPLYRGLGYSGDTVPAARRLAAEVLSLPVHPGLSREDLDAIVAAVNEWTAEHAAE
ncbi:MAG TPA: DegT/DnrJ/EryC1/StrS family aminotransferase [Dehalococcoidia bacterium]|nr:DegT/DnrJ/EryC1/StrS family aminotransferase [Dehalococcoidia bacterium]